MSWWQFPLFPFAIIYDLVTRCRNWLFDIGVLRTYEFPQVKIVSVGNLSLGGTGKTPHVELIIRWAIQNKIEAFVLSRGYGRKTNGPRIAGSADTADTLGDESFGYFQDYGSSVGVCVAEKRAEGVRMILENYPDTRLVILDDAYQHRSLHRDLNILLTTYDRPYWKDYLVPSGRLRESRSGSKRADMVVITKCPDQSDRISDDLHSRIVYGNIESISGTISHDVVAVAGLADNEPFFQHVSKKYNMVARFTFDDHHTYSQKEVEVILEMAKGATIVTTKKDVVKLKEFESMKNSNLGFIPITVDLMGGEKQLEDRLEELMNE